MAMVELTVRFSHTSLPQPTANLSRQRVRPTYDAEVENVLSSVLSAFQASEQTLVLHGLGLEAGNGVWTRKWAWRKF
jgi:hypothetical protein